MEPPTYPSQAGAPPTGAPPVSAAESSHEPCEKCAASKQPAAAPPSYVYAVGRIEPRFPKLSLEREFAQVIARTDTKGLTDHQAFQSVLSRPENRYLSRQICWVMKIAELDTYALFPRDPIDLPLLVEALRPHPGPGDLNVVVGVKGPLATPEMTGGLAIPLVAFDQVYPFDRRALITAIPRPTEIEASAFEAAAGELLDRVMQLTDNAGATDEHRALNYLAVRYDAIYARTAKAFSENASLSAVDVRPSSLAGQRRIVEVIFAYTHRATDVTDKYSVRVDVSDEFPFLVSRLGTYYDR